MHSAASAREEIREIERRISDQQANLKRTIMQGCPTQAAEDALRKLQATLQRMKRDGSS
jgi:hypothetical protein